MKGRKNKAVKKKNTEMISEKSLGIKDRINKEKKIINQ